MARFFFAILLLCVLLFPASPAVADDSRPVTPLFNTTEIRSPNLASFTNWTGMLARYQRVASLGAGMCASAGPGGGVCEWDEWVGIVQKLQGLSAVEQLRAVNDIMNAHRYVLDRENWGVEDYWQTVFEFVRRDGDCEDYAIAKYITLRALGWPPERLRLVIVRDTKLDLNHAILAAYTDQGIYIGDNQVDGLVKAENIRHYKAIYSINEQNWWLHRARG